MRSEGRFFKVNISFLPHNTGTGGASPPDRQGALFPRPRETVRRERIVPRTRHMPAIAFRAALLAFTVFLALDTFVFSASYREAGEVNTAMFSVLSTESEAAEESAAESATAASVTKQRMLSGSRLAPGSRKKHGSGLSSDESAAGTDAESGATKNSSSLSAAAAASDTSYRDENVSITLTETEEYGTKIYVADVTLRSAAFLKTAFANNTYGKNVTANTSQIAQENNAVLAINGDYYGVQEKGYVIRNGVVYRGTAKGADILCIYADGTMEVVSDRAYTAEELVQNGVWQAFSFGPALLEDGSVTVGENSEVGRAMTSNPRTAIGMIDANHFVFVVSDGRSSESEGLSLYELASFMKSLGVKTAYNLDGGGSSTMVFNGRVVNNPTTGGAIKERGVSDIVYI